MLPLTLRVAVILVLLKRGVLLPEALLQLVLVLKRQEHDEAEPNRQIHRQEQLPPQGPGPTGYLPAP